MIEIPWTCSHPSLVPNRFHEATRATIVLRVLVKSLPMPFRLISNIYLFSLNDFFSKFGFVWLWWKLTKKVKEKANDLIFHNFVNFCYTFMWQFLKQNFSSLGFFWLSKKLMKSGNDKRRNRYGILKLLWLSIICGWDKFVLDKFLFSIWNFCFEKIVKRKKNDYLLRWR